MRFIRALCLGALLVPVLGAQELGSDPDRALYALGYRIGGQLKQYGLSAEELQVMYAGVTDAVTVQKPDDDLGKGKELLQAFLEEKREACIMLNANMGDAYRARAVLEKGAVKTDSGLVYIPLREGTGARPGPADVVKVHYRGWLVDGTEFDSSYARNAPLEFVLDQVIKGWAEGLQRMRAGGRARLVLPSELAYGEKGNGPDILPHATLIFEVELLEVKKKP